MNADKIDGKTVYTFLAVTLGIYCTGNIEDTYSFSLAVI